MITNPDTGAEEYDIYSAVLWGGPGQEIYGVEGLMHVSLILAVSTCYGAALYMDKHIKNPILLRIACGLLLVGAYCGQEALKTLV